MSFCIPMAAKLLTPEKGTTLRTEEREVVGCPDQRDSSKLQGWGVGEGTDDMALHTLSVIGRSASYWMMLT